MEMFDSREYHGWLYGLVVDPKSTNPEEHFLTLWFDWVQDDLDSPADHSVNAHVGTGNGDTLVLAEEDDGVIIRDQGRKGKVGSTW